MAWQPGQCGNPNGRPKGSRSQKSLRIERYRKTVLRQLIKYARRGDKEVLQFLASRMIPPLRAVLVPVQLPDLAASKTLDGKGRAVLDAAARGRLTPDHTESYLNALLQQAELTEHDALMERIQKLEAAVNGQQETRTPPPRSKKPRERL